MKAEIAKLKKDILFLKRQRRAHKQENIRLENDLRRERALKRKYKDFALSTYEKFRMLEPDKYWPKETVLSWFKELF